MKTVFPNSEVPHIWAKQSQQTGRNSANNVYFNGPKIYSYGSHFCMGNILKSGIVLLTDRSYSVSTSKHLGWVRYAVNHLERVYCPFPDGSLVENLNVWKSRIKTELDFIADPKKRAHTKERAKGTLSSIVANINEYLKVTGQSLTKKLPIEDSKRKEFILFFEAAQNEQAAGDLVKKLAKIEKAKARAAEKLRLENLKKQRENLMKWKRGANIQTWSFSNIDGVHLRAKGEDIETSKGARVSLKAGAILYKMIKAGKDVKGYDIEGYTVLGVNGVLKVGCHEIDRKEVERFAKSQNW